MRGTVRSISSSGDGGRKATSPIRKSGSGVPGGIVKSIISSKEGGLNASRSTSKSGSGVPGWYKGGGKSTAEENQGDSWKEESNSEL